MADNHDALDVAQTEVERLREGILVTVHGFVPGVPS